MRPALIRAELAGRKDASTTNADRNALLLTLGVSVCFSAQVASLLADDGAQPSQAQRHLIQRNQGLLKFVEQDYQGTARPCYFRNTWSLSQQWWSSSSIWSVHHCVWILLSYPWQDLCKQ